MKRLALSLALTTVSSLAAAQDAREAEMFGSSSTISDELSSSRDEDIFGAGDDESKESTDSEARAEALLKETDNILDIGGRAFMGFNYNIARDAEPADYPFSSPNLVDIYLDARPNDHVRTYMRGRLNFDPSITDGETNAFGQAQSSTDVLLEQLWLKFDIDRQLFATIGRQPVKWGSSRFWNPSDFINQSIRDPLAVFDQRVGPTLVKLHYPLESLGWNFYALARLDNADTYEKIGGALRGEFLLGNTEISLSTLLAKSEPTRIALDISTAIWDFDVRVEGAAQKGVKTPFWRRIEGSDPFTSIESYLREDDWIYQVVAGADLTIQYSDEDSLSLGVEYFYNDAGYEDASLYGWLALQGQFQPFYLGKQYAAAYVFLLNPGDWNDTQFILSGIGNLSDKSFLTRLDYRVTLLTYLSLNLFASYHFGQRGEFKYGFSVPPIAGIPGLSQGIEVPAPTLDLGMRFTVNW